MKKYFLLFVLCFAIFIIHLILVKHGIYGDGNGYYTYTQALYFDKGLNFGPIYDYLGHFQGVKGEFSRIFWDIRSNPFPIGTGIIWIPSVALISLFSQDRFSLIYEVGPGLTGILLVLGGLYFLEKYLQNFFSKKIALTSVLFFFLTSNLFYYSSFEPALSHQPAFFLISFLLYKSYKMKADFFNFFLVGALSGLLFITRVPDSILLIPIYYQLLLTRSQIKYWAVTLISAIFFTLPLFLSYQVMFGNPFHMTYLEGGLREWSFSTQNVFDFFLSAKRGLFIWTPVYLLGFIGLIKSRKFLFLLSLIALILICSFWAGVSVAFGQRFVLAAIPYFTFGLAKFIEKVDFKKVAILFIALLTWNFLTIFQFYFDKTNLIKNDNLTLPTFIKGQFESPIEAFKVIKERGLNYFFYKKVLY
jgi:hypothetical protein